MNGIIALCHFCEAHGPRILFCTQAVHSSEPQSQSLLIGESQALKDASAIQKNAVSDKLPRNSSDDDILNAASDIANPSKIKQEELCDACRSMPEHKTGYISQDVEASVQYVSTQQPRHPDLVKILRIACTRGLSCEIIPDTEGPIFFGDSTRGHVISYAFYLKDIHARGGKRLYSAMIVMMDKVYLLNMWPFLVEQLKDMVCMLKGKSNEVFVNEEQHIKAQNRAIATPLKAVPQDRKQVRSLMELTDTKSIFKNLHKRFVWILKAGSNRLTEHLLEGPPTEDSVIDLEKQEETEEGFVKLFKKNDLPENEECSSDEVCSENSSYTSENANDSDNDLADNPKAVFHDLRHLMNIIGKPKFHILAHHLVIGNQVVIRGGQKALIKSIINSLKNFLPLGCCRTVQYSKKYVESYKCNLLGLHQGIQVPTHASMYIIMDIIEPENAMEAQEDLDGVFVSEADVAARAGFDQVDITGDIIAVPVTESDHNAAEASCATSGNPSKSLFLFNNYVFILTTPLRLSEKGPSALTKMETALADQTLAYCVIEQYLVCIKEEWMNKVKLFFKFTKAGGRRAEEDTKQLLRLIGANAEDEAVLKFWMTGLSVQYRNSRLSSATSSM